MSYEIRFAPGVDRELTRLPRAILGRVDAVIMSLAEMARPSGCKKLVGSKSTYRVCVGDWRIVYENDNKQSWVIATIVAHRRDVYRGM